MWVTVTHAGTGARAARRLRLATEPWRKSQSPSRA